jgi:hypothetical protein
VVIGAITVTGFGRFFPENPEKIWKIAIFAACC